MALTTFVKISTISNLSDARYCAGMGVDQLGFNFDPTSEEHITTELFSEIKNWIAGVQFVGEFGNATAEQITELQKDLPIELIELSNLRAVEKVHLLGKPLSFRLSIDHQVHLQDLSGTLSYLDELVDQIVVESSSPEFFVDIKTEINFYNGRLKLLKAFNVHADSIHQIGNFSGIEMQGTPEKEPGLKDYGQVMDVLEALEDED